MKRIAQRIYVKPDRLEGYKQQHANIWPTVAKAIEQANLHNYSINYLDGELFAYMEYTGDDYEADMKRPGESESMQQWCRICSEMQFSPGLPDGTWVDMEEVFIRHNCRRSLLYGNIPRRCRYFKDTLRYAVRHRRA